jgi:uncharacterized protein (DUF305 family)
MRINRTFATLVAALPLVALAACSASDDSSAKAFNDADVTFAQEMIPHHRQATEMAKLADGRTTTPEVLELASGIIAAQQPEIDVMSGWLESWDKDVPSESGDMGDMEGMDHGSSDMPGMMSDDDMSKLESLSGGAFDDEFLTMMIEHHQGAIEMASTEEADGAYPKTVALARKIQKDQAAEIQKMAALRTP